MGKKKVGEIVLPDPDTGRVLREKGYLYFVDAVGAVRRVARKGAKITKTAGKKAKKALKNAGRKAKGKLKNVSRKGGK